MSTLSDGIAEDVQGRIERKFWLPVEEADEVERCVARHLPRDKHHDHGSEKQTESTIYLDSPNLLLLKAALGDKPDRFKLRVRRYDNPPHGPVFIEWKGKVKGDVQKLRAQVSHTEAKRLLSGVCDPDDLDLPDEETRNAAQFSHAMKKIDAKPKLITRTRRMAYGHGGGDDARATFDRGMSAAKVDSLDFDPDVEKWYGMSTPTPSGVLLELKYSDGEEPEWMKQMERTFELKQVKHSKALHAAHILYGLEVPGLPK